MYNPITNQFISREMRRIQTRLKDLSDQRSNYKDALEILTDRGFCVSSLHLDETEVRRLSILALHSLTTIESEMRSLRARRSALCSEGTKVYA